jgi:predicted signal transduction protein with EAL and GGDEF domain
MRSRRLTCVDILHLPFETIAGTAHIGASIGIALYPQNGQNLETLLDHADISMYHVKTSGANGWMYTTKEEENVKKSHSNR